MKDGMKKELTYSMGYSAMITPCESPMHPGENGARVTIYQGEHLIQTRRCTDLLSAEKWADHYIALRVAGYAN